MVSASAIGYYGDRGNELLTEESEPGTMFLSEVCKEWEAAAEPAREAGVRVVHPRFGIVLSTEGGALGTTLPIFKLGGGGRIGQGDSTGPGSRSTTWSAPSFMPSRRMPLSGPVNVVAPEPPTNAEYTRVPGRRPEPSDLLRRPGTGGSAIALGENGGRSAPGQRPRRAREAEGDRLRIPLSGARRRPATPAREGVPLGAEWPSSALFC